jgi:hypothetical protein
LNPHHHPISARAALALALLAGAVGLASCGSSKPAYCDNRTKLENSVKNISVSGGLSSLKTQLQTIESQAKSLVSSAKGDFPDETSAITSSVNQLSTTIKSIPSSPSVSDLATAANDAKSVVTSVNAFVSSTKSKCS